ncbi:MAG: hypothetical protein HRT89_13215 [Lentisphaeria bacterium]|nr:hypothetical protein [Lentisphaeria bacterium]NQZ69017.1 hypothetical protein [Lentisphaeria bacterium]
MKNLLITLLAVCSLTLFAQYPEATLDNGKVKMKIYLPDGKTGYYRAPRFDWSGMIASATWNKHEYFGPRVKKEGKKHDPMGGDDVVGPAEEFSMQNPPGFKEAKVGEGFMKIGVGILEKGKGNYAFYMPQKIKEAGTWKVKAEKTKITFNQSLKLSDDWAYSYEKTISLKDDGFVISHKLTNDGKKDIATNFYNHNFIRIDGADLSVGYTAETPGVLKLAEAQAKDLVTKCGKADGKNFTLPAKTDFFHIRQHKADKGGTFSLTNPKSKGKITISSSMEATHWDLFMIKYFVCPEPFLDLKVAAGKSITWDFTYTFSEAK